MSNVDIQQRLFLNSVHGKEFNFVPTNWLDEEVGNLSCVVSTSSRQTKMAETLWRECANWLVRCQVIKEENYPPSTEVRYFANSLRDGSLLCRLIKKLDPMALDISEVSHSNHMPQFLCQKNIRLFLQACRKHFDLKDSELFEPQMLLDYTDFAKVLQTLSKLSRCSKVVKLGIEGFSVTTPRQHYEDEEEIYRRLEDFDQEDQTNWSGANGLCENNGNLYYDFFCPFSDENIYEDLCSLEKSDPIQTDTPLSPPVEKRDHTILEIVETEKNYVKVLNMIYSHFIIPLSEIIPEDERKIIFFGIEKLCEIHSGLHSDLLGAYSGTNGTKMYLVFVNWKEKLLIYGNYCSNLTSAQHHIDLLCSKNEQIAREIQRCEKESSNGKFGLKDLLVVPMQRILKYHLLLRELCKNTQENHEDYHGLKVALDAMVDVADYINEVKKDSEMLRIISDVQASISDWRTMEFNPLKDYGRLIKDGELKMRSHEDGNKQKTRYVFVFSRTVVFCKITRGEQYSYRSSLHLDNFKLEDCSGRGREARWNYQWLLVDNHNKTAYTLCAKTQESKNKWIRAFQEAIEHLHPQEGRNSGHNFVMQSFSSPSNCDHCGKLLKGLFFQGYKCLNCRTSAHRCCLGMFRGCGIQEPPPPPPRPRLRQPDMVEYIDQPWFAGEMSRPVAETILKMASTGTFLVRYRVPEPSRRNDTGYALSLKTVNDEVKHMRIIRKTEDSPSSREVFFLSVGRKFHSVIDLVEFYESNSLVEAFNGLDALLEFPWKFRFQTAVVIVDYLTNDNHCLELRKGQHIIICGKERDSSGWWRGSFGPQVGYFPKTYVKEDCFIQQH